LTPGGYFFIVVTLCFVWVNYSRDKNNAMKLAQSQNSKAIVDDKLQHSTDDLRATSESLRVAQNKFSTLQISIKDTILNRVEASNLKIIKATNDGLEKYNLVFIDSLKSIKPVNKPQISFLAAGENSPEEYVSNEDGDDILNIKMKSINNIAFNIELKYCVLSNNRLDKFKESIKVLECSNYINKISHQMLIPGNFATVKIDLNKTWLNLQCEIYFYGTFSSDVEGKNKIPFRNAIIYDFPNRKYLGTDALENVESITDFLKKRNLLN